MTRWVTWSWTIVMFFGERNSIAVGDSGSRLSRDTDENSAVEYPS